MIKNYFYDSAIIDRVKEILEDKLQDTENFKSIVLGEFSTLASVREEDFWDFFPAILIYPHSNHVDYQNQNSTTLNHNIRLNIDYICPYDGSDIDKWQKCIENTGKISSVLVSDSKLDDFYVDKSEDEVGCEIIGSEISKCTYDDEISRLFSDLLIPLTVSRIRFNIRIQGLIGE